MTEIVYLTDVVGGKWEILRAALDARIEAEIRGRTITYFKMTREQWEEVEGLMTVNVVNSQGHSVYKDKTIMGVPVLEVRKCNT